MILASILFIKSLNLANKPSETVSSVLSNSRDKKENRDEIRSSTSETCKATGALGPGEDEALEPLPFLPWLLLARLTQLHIRPHLLHRPRHTFITPILNVTVGTTTFKTKRMYVNRETTHPPMASRAGNDEQNPRTKVKVERSWTNAGTVLL